MGRKKSIKTLLMLAENGDINAQYELGVRYRSGDGVEISRERQFYWFGIAAIFASNASARG